LTNWTKITMQYKTYVLYLQSVRLCHYEFFGKC